MFLSPEIELQLPAGDFYTSQIYCRYERFTYIQFDPSEKVSIRYT